MTNEQINVTCAKLLAEKGLTVAVAESCTGGLISTRLTETAGSSAYFECGLVTYSNASKVKLLGVPKEVIDEHGAVSRETAAAMAKGALGVSGADIAVAVTGIAGPSGGTREKPVGTVFIALATKDALICDRYDFGGNRCDVREKTSHAALSKIVEFIKASVRP